MPDANNLPTLDDVTAKLATVIDTSTLTTAQTNDIGSVIAAVIADFEAPPGPRGSGGTGRRISPVTITFLFDGNDTNILTVPNIISPTVDEDDNPVNPVTISVFNTPITDFTLVDSNDGLGITEIERNTQYWYGSFGNGYYGWPVGEGNISITASWALSTSNPADIYEAIRCEAAARVLIASQGGVVGLGKRIKSESVEVSESTSTASFNMVTSAITTWRKQFVDKVKAYRDRGQNRTALGRMAY
jgi:hypothetical protein